MNTRRTQPYRQGPRVPGPALVAMLTGRPAFLPNPQDHVREAQRSALVAALMRRY